MTGHVVQLLLAIIALSVLGGLLPLLGALAHALVPLVIVVTSAALLMRVVWYLISR